MVQRGGTTWEACKKQGKAAEAGGVYMQLASEQCNSIWVEGRQSLPMSLLRSSPSSFLPLSITSLSPPCPLPACLPACLCSLLLPGRQKVCLFCFPRLVSCHVATPYQNNVFCQWSLLSVTLCLCLLFMLSCITPPFSRSPVPSFSFFCHVSQTCLPEFLPYKCFANVVSQDRTMSSQQEIEILVCH